MSLKSSKTRVIRFINQFTPRSHHRLALMIIGVVSVVISLGIALVSLLSLLGALLIVYFIITRVFGIRLDLPNTVRI